MSEDSWHITRASFGRGSAWMGWAFAVVCVVLAEVFCQATPLQVDPGQQATNPHFGYTVLVPVASALGLWAVKVSQEQHQHVVDAVTGLATAWGGLQAATGITTAVQRNLAYVEAHPPAEGARKIREELSGLWRDLQSARPVVGRGDAAEMIDDLRQRYRDVKDVNDRVTGLLPDSHHARRHAVTEAAPSLSTAKAAWDAQVLLARPVASRWPHLAGDLNALDAMVRSWFVFAANDPYYWETDPRLRTLRSEAHEKARQSVNDLTATVARKTYLYPLRRKRTTTRRATTAT